MRFLHTADWQMGMRAESVGKMADRVREERLAASQRAVQAARDHNAEMLILTGDVFEDNAVDRLLVRKVGEILRGFGRPVFIIPGNHDPLVPGSVWEHSVWKEAENITVFTKNEPLELDACVLFPCPLREKYSSKDPTAWIDANDAATPAIGMAHGNVEGLPSAEPDYPIPRDAATRRGLDYLTLGHWHSFAQYDNPAGECRLSFSDTHETTSFGERDSGNAILVEISSRGDPQNPDCQQARVVCSTGVLPVASRRSAAPFPAEPIPQLAIATELGDGHCSISLRRQRCRNAGPLAEAAR